MCRLTDWFTSFVDNLAFTTIILWLIFFTDVFGGTNVEWSMWWKDLLNSIMNFFYSSFSVRRVIKSMSLWVHYHHGILVQEGTLVGKLTADEETKAQRWRGLKTPILSSGFLLHYGLIGKQRYGCGLGHNYLKLIFSGLFSSGPGSAAVPWKASGTKLWILTLNFWKGK